MRTVLPALMLLAGLVSARAGEATVTIDNFAFNPAEITVPAGTTVTWINRDDIPHVVVGSADKALLKSDALDTDDRYSAIFTTLGTYGYFCSLHPHMQGSVVVK